MDRKSGNPTGRLHHDKFVQISSTVNFVTFIQCNFTRFLYVTNQCVGKSVAWNITMGWLISRAGYSFKNFFFRSLQMPNLYEHKQAVLFNWNSFQLKAFLSLSGRFKIYIGLEWFKKCLTERVTVQRYCACLDLNSHHVEDKSNPNRNVNIGEMVTVVR